MANIIRVPVKGKQEVEVDTQLIMPEGLPSGNGSDDLKQARMELVNNILREGLKVILNRKLSKLSVTGLEGDELQGQKEAIMAVVKENLADVYEGKVKRIGGKKVKTSDRAVTAAARRIAKELVKQEIRRHGGKLSYFSGRQLTAAADEMISDDPRILEQAKAEVAATSEIGKGTKFDISKMVPDPKRVAAEKAKTDAKKEVLSKIQAGRTRVHENA